MRSQPYCKMCLILTSVLRCSARNDSHRVNYLWVVCSFQYHSRSWLPQDMEEYQGIAAFDMYFCLRHNASNSFFKFKSNLIYGINIEKTLFGLSFPPQFGKFLRSCTKQNQIAVVECGNKITVKKDFYLESAKIVSLFGSAPMVC